MTLSSNLFANAIDQAFLGNVKWTTDTIKMALLTSSASPNLGTWVHYSDLTNEVASGSGYTTGGATLASCSATVVVANSWTVQWAASTAETVGQLVRPPTGNGYVYRCVVAGTTAGTAPTWPTVVGAVVTDSGVTWQCAGESVTVYTSAAASWPGSTSSAAFGVIYDAQSGTGSTEPLICLVTFGTTVADVVSVAPDANCGFFATTPA
jgi:hypothetical protein